MSSKRKLMLTTCGIILIAGLAATNFAVAHHYYEKGFSEGLKEANARLTSQLSDAVESEFFEKTRLSVPVLKAIWAHPESFDQVEIGLWHHFGKVCVIHGETVSLPELKKKGDDKNYEFYSKLVTELKSLTAQLPLRK